LGADGRPPVQRVVQGPDVRAVGEGMVVEELIARLLDGVHPRRSVLQRRATVDTRIGIIRGRDGRGIASSMPQASRAAPSADLAARVLFLLMEGPLSCQVFLSSR
jgi:hypothetical protein